MLNNEHGNGILDYILDSGNRHWTEILDETRLAPEVKFWLRIVLHDTLQHIETETKWPPISWWQFQMHFLQNISISVKISQKFVSKGPINNIPASVQKMAWRRLGGDS